MNEIFIDYETICVNCKQKGYNFGYSFKTIEYNGETVLDMPQRHLNGATLYFEYQKNPVIMHCLENAHQDSEESKKPVFSMINAKQTKDDAISRFTYLYQPHNDPRLNNNEGRDEGQKVIDQNQCKNPNSQLVDPLLYFYLDMYKPQGEPYFLLFYTFKLTGEVPFHNFKFFQLFDFDIYGEDRYDTDFAFFNQETDTICQYDSETGKEKSLFSCLGSLENMPPSHFEVNNPKKILINENRSFLRDLDAYGPSDCAVALQWDIGELNPHHAEVFPVFVSFGEGIEDSTNNIKRARAHLKKIHPTIYNVINDKYRQIIDPKLEEMSFSMRKWCT